MNTSEPITEARRSTRANRLKLSAGLTVVVVLVAGIWFWNSDGTTDTDSSTTKDLCPKISKSKNTDKAFEQVIPSDSKSDYTYSENKNRFGFSARCDVTLDGKEVLAAWAELANSPMDDWRKGLEENGDLGGLGEDIEFPVGDLAISGPETANIFVQCTPETDPENRTRSLTVQAYYIGDKDRDRELRQSLAQIATAMTGYAKTLIGCTNPVVIPDQAPKITAQR